MIPNGLCEDWNKVERLAIAGVIAPAIRGQDEKKKSRRIAIKDKNGNIVRYTTLAELQKELLEKRGIELETTEGIKQRWSVCEECHLAFMQPRFSRKKIICKSCSKGSCDMCGSPFRYYAKKPSIARKRGSVQKLCFRCSNVKRTKAKSTCDACGTNLSRSVSTKKYIQKYSGRKQKCKRCVGKDRRAARLSCGICGVELGRHASQRRAVDRRKRLGIEPRCAKHKFTKRKQEKEQ